MSDATEKNHTVGDYKRDLKPVWCTGCGDYGVLQSIYRSLNAMDLEPENVGIVSGIGCSSRLPGYVNTYGFNSVHGRALPLAQGLRLARPDITVLAVGGDGDGVSIGMGHFPHAARRNINMTYIMMDNCIYGLTKGQTSPTTPLGDVTVSTPYGSVDTTLDPVQLALSFNVSFIARAFAGDLKHLAEIIEAAVRHEGFSFVHVISPCVTYRGMGEFKRVRELVEKVFPSRTDLLHRTVAFAREEHSDGINLGILYCHPRPTYDVELDEISARSLDTRNNTSPSMEDFLDEFMP
ncbi:MAG: 2-oxoacid:ferredoxin oxidoreductase subunit beta [bacterium]|nr:2-oxoacid:ferredoxin oxidoreductase subunit beta [bacterium]